MHFMHGVDLHICESTSISVRARNPRDLHTVELTQTSLESSSTNFYRAALHLVFSQRINSFSRAHAQLWRATVIPQQNDHFDLDQGLAGPLRERSLERLIWINVGDVSP
jgi:hypothetical protein